MRYKNTSGQTLRFRAFDSKGKKIKMELKPEEDFETIMEVKFPGIELVEEKKKSKKELKEEE